MKDYAGGPFIGIRPNKNGISLITLNQAEKYEEGEVYRAERFFGKFQRTVTLPTPVAVDKVKAQYKDGILTITLPKTEEAKPKQIDVNVS